MLRLKFRLRRKPFVEGHNLLRAARRTAVMLMVVAALHVVAMMVFEGLPPGEALWLTATTMTTVGYGDLSAATPAGRLATVLLAYGVGIFLLANLATHWFDYRADRRQRMINGRWNWNMENHIVILNAPARQPERYFCRLLREIRQWPAFDDRPIQIVTRAFEDCRVRSGSSAPFITTATPTTPTPCSRRISTTPVTSLCSRSPNTRRDPTR